MKSINKQIFTLILFSFFTILALGQDDPKPYLDTIKIDLENRLEINISMHNCNNFGESLTNNIKSFEKVLQKVNLNEYDYKYFLITYVPNETLTIRQKPPVERIIIKNDTLVRSQLNHKCNIIGEDYTLSILFNNVQDILNEDLNTQIQTVLDSLPEKTRWASCYNYSFEDNKLSSKKYKDKVNGGMDILELKGSVGASLINNKPVSDISAEIGVKYCKKGLYKHNYYLSYNSLGLLNANNNVNINGFANIGYRYNLSNNRFKPNWIGVELGYLTSRNGDFFDKNTFKLGVNWGIGKYISVTPQLFFSPEGNMIAPSFRIGFGF